MKNRAVIILAVLAAGFFLAAIGSYNNALRQKAGRDKEMASRLQMEEKMSKFFQEKSALEEKIKAKEGEAEETREELEETKEALAQQQLENQSLKEELQKIDKKMK